MKCPLCHVDLVMTERQGVEIDYCPQCRGVWLDRGELDKIIEKATGPTVQPEPQPGPQPAPQRAPDPQVWQEPYREPQRSSRDDRDRHYIDRDRERDRDRDWDRDRYRDDGRYRKKKRKSILSEIFDFD